MKTGPRFKELRERAGISQQDLADRLGQVRQAVVRFESEYHNPNLRTLQEWCGAIGVTLSEFFQSPIPNQYKSAEQAEIHRQLQEVLQSNPALASSLTLMIESAWNQSRRLHRSKRRRGQVKVPA